MPRTGRAYEKPSRIAQGLVACFSVAVVAMAGWLAITIISHGAGTMAVADSMDIETTSAHPVVENVVAEPQKPSAADRFNSAYFDPAIRNYPSSTATTPPQSALALTALAEPLPVTARDPGFPAPSITTAIPDMSYRDIPIDEPSQEQAVIGVPDANAELVPLPPPNPRRIAAIPVPRPRPRTDGEDTQPAADPSFFDLLISRQR